MRSFSPLQYDFTLLIIIIIIIIICSILDVLFRRFMVGVLLSRKIAPIIRDFESRLRQTAKSEFVPRD